LSFSCLLILTLSLFPNACFLCGMGIIGCRLSCFTLICLHDDEPFWHIFVDSIVLDTFHALV
jgi:hypothetical protein